ncbi:33150_t:CDS:2, partial [Racocetra persica]
PLRIKNYLAREACACCHVNETVKETEQCRTYAHRCADENTEQSELRRK